MSEVPAAPGLAEAVRDGMRRAAGALGASQAPDGHWPGDYGGPEFLLPGLVIAWAITGFPLGGAQQAGMVRYLRATRRPGAGWGLHLQGASTVFGTTLNYVALRLLGVPADDPDAAEARGWLADHGGAEGVPTWGKVWLAVLGVYRWEGVSPLPPELWVLPRGLPVHPGTWWCHTRAVYLPMCRLYAARWQGPETAVVRALREEVLVTPWAEIDWPSLRERVSSTDLYAPHSPWLEAANRAFALYERLPKAGLRRRAVRLVREQIRYEDETSGYLTIGPVSKALHLLVAWFEDPDGEAFRRHVARVGDYLWETGRGVHMQGYNGSQLWDTAFALRALRASGLPARGEALDVLRAAHGFVDAQQIRADLPEHGRHFRDRSAGAWPFSTAEQGWPVSDCTAEGLMAALGSADLVTEPIPAERLRAAVDRLLEWQNPDGGWSEYERARGSKAMERLNAAEVFDDIMIAYSYTECTSASMQGLLAFRSAHPGYREAEIERAVQAGEAYLRARQRPDGSWYGGWGVCFTYGSWFGVAGLRAAGATAEDEAVARARAFLLAHQRPDGAWGEAFASSPEKRWIEGEPHPVQTAWALLALMATADDPSDPRVAEPVERGIHWLLAHQRDDGTWPTGPVVGVFNRTCAIHYANYPAIFPLWALGRFGGSTS